MKKTTVDTVNEQQRRVLATFVVGLTVAIMFFIPYRVEPRDEIKWAPFYRPPISEVRSYADGGTRTSIRYEDGEIAAGVLVLQILVISGIGGMAYLLVAD